jgi:tetratricopeptide (TPR) repeat protein
MRDEMGRWGVLLLCSLLVAAETCIAAKSDKLKSQPILIPGVQEPDEMRVEPFPINKVDLPARMQELAGATNNFSKVDPTAMLPALDRILAKYPEFADGYVFRLYAFCESNDRRKAMSDINNAIKFMDNSLVKDNFRSLVSTRAKLLFADGDYAGAMNGLEQAIRSDLHRATDFTNSGAVKPEKTASLCVWTEPDMDALVERFPNDYRAFLFRGLYYSFFATFDETSVKPAIENFDRAAQLSSTSALPPLFKAELLANFLVFGKRLNELGWSDTGRAKLNTELAGEFGKAPRY